MFVEWSVLYVVVGLCSAGLCVTGFIWGIAFLCSRACQQRRVRTSNQRPPKYALLEDDDQSNCKYIKRNYKGQSLKCNI